MNIEKQITLSALEAVKELYGAEVPEKMIQLQKTRPDFEGNITLVVFPCSARRRRNPRIQPQR